MSLQLSFHSDWTLFLDRDGVINKKLDGYVTKPKDFKFLGGVLAALPILSNIFERIIIVTNQQGIGKGIMTHDDLHSVHSHMLRNIELAGGRIDNIYYCPHLATENPPCRKPNPGMAIQAKSDYPSIDFKKSIMVGDSESDIVFGNKLMMTTVKISQLTTTTEADMSCSSLSDFLQYIN